MSSLAKVWSGTWFLMPEVSLLEAISRKAEHVAKEIAPKWLRLRRTHLDTVLPMKPHLRFFDLYRPVARPRDGATSRIPAPLLPTTDLHCGIWSSEHLSSISQFWYGISRIKDQYHISEGVWNYELFTRSKNSDPEARNSSLKPRAPFNPM